MLRRSASTLTRNQCNILKTFRSHRLTTNTLIYSSTFEIRSASLRLSQNTTNAFDGRQPFRAPVRFFSSQKTKKNGPSSNEGNLEAEEMSQEIVLTPGQKVVAGTRLSMWAGIAVLASCCAYYIGKELLPSKMSPNSVFDKSFSIIREYDEVKNRFGTPLKAYGRDHGGHREGRRNFIEHTQYKDQEDGSNRTRVRYNLEGKFGNAFVFAEASSDMPSGEFAYILVQDKRNGHVITVVDNRSAIAAARMAGGSKEGMDAFAKLLGGAGGKSQG